MQGEWISRSCEVSMERKDRKEGGSGIVEEWDEDTSDTPTEQMPIRIWKKEVVKEDLEDLFWWDW